jgi:hypothetical protein
MTELAKKAPRALIVSNNVVEADDLTELLTGQGLGPVRHARDIDNARKVLAEAGDELRLMMCGLSLHLHEVKEFLDTLKMPDLALLVIDGPAQFLEREGAGVVQRPFSTSDVLVALERLGLSD